MTKCVILTTAVKEDKVVIKHLGVGLCGGTVIMIIAGITVSNPTVSQGAIALAVIALVLVSYDR